MSDENVGGLVELPKPIRAMVRFTALQHIERDVYTAEQLHAYADARVEAALSAHGQPVDYSPALHSVLSYIAYGECDEEGLHPGLFATVKEKIDKLRSQPVVDGRYFADGPQGWFVTDNPELARALVNAYDNGDDWTVTDIGYVAGALG